MSKDKDRQVLVCRRIAGIHLQAGEPDWLRSTCNDCGHPIWYNLKSPTMPDKICDECCATMVANAKDDDEIVFEARTPEIREYAKQMIETLAYWRKPKK